MVKLPFGHDHEASPGTIVLWADSLSSIPAGWVLCDGNNGTPNLLNKFVSGTGSSSDSTNSSGGVNSQTISPSQMAQHSHGGSTSTTGDHSHTVYLDNQGANTGQWNDNAPEYDSDFSRTIKTDSNYHDHNISLGQSGSGGSVENVPQNYEVAFIMKI
jgi:microcystin-dependent protein